MPTAFKYRMVEDQANIGIEPLGFKSAKASNGTYHGRVFLVQSRGPNLGDGWEFRAAFTNEAEALQFQALLKRA